MLKLPEKTFRKIHQVFEREELCGFIVVNRAAFILDLNAKGESEKIAWAGLACQEVAWHIQLSKRI